MIPLLLFWSLIAVAEPCNPTIDPDRELTIVNPIVLNDVRADAGGPWHMSTLLREMLPESATDSDLARFVSRFLRKSKETTRINGFDLRFPGFAFGERAICRWLKETSGVNCQVADEVDPSRIPYKLIAIVNRLDLEGHFLDRAEGRFVFGAITLPNTKPGTDAGIQGAPETVIFEYHLPASTEVELKEWARRWHGLSEIQCTPSDCETYRQALQKITDKFSRRNLVMNRPNGNPIGQIRTSHVAPNEPNLWSFRQFELEGDGTTAELVSAPVSQTPHHSLDGSEELKNLLNQNAQSVMDKKFVVPRNLLGAEAILDEFQPAQWQLPGVDPAVKDAFASETCNGCHRVGNIKDDFFQISPLGTANRGRERLSEFLDIDETPKRAANLKRLLCE